MSQSTASSPVASFTPVHCLVFVRSAFGDKAAEQLDRAQSYLIQHLHSTELISSRLYFHAHFPSAERLKAALDQSRQSNGPHQPTGAVCLQRNCGHERHSVEGRVKRAGLDYSLVRRWILANKRVVLYDEVFRDLREEKKDGEGEKGRGEGPGEGDKTAAATEEEVRARIDATQQQLGYSPLPPSDPQDVVTSPNTSRTSSVSQGATVTPRVPSSSVTSPPPSKPSSSSSLKVYVKSRQGASWDPSKVNQDRPLACVPLRGHPGVHVYGVMDGHGQWGHHVSEYVMQTLPAFLSAEKGLKGDVEGAMHRAVRNVCEGLSQANINLSFSGTTCVFAVHCNDTLYTANIGDSRCVLIRAPDLPAYPPFTIALTSDHKPDVPSEQQRILKAGGRVCPIPGMDSGPPRVWLKDLDEPGLAMSRSIGDEVSASVGVIATPDITVHQLEERDVAALFASDGVWEFISNEEAVRLVWKYLKDQPAAAVNALVAEAVSRWKEDSDQIIDDITVVLVVFGTGKAYTHR